VDNYSNIFYRSDAQQMASLTIAVFQLLLLQPAEVLDNKTALQVSRHPKRCRRNICSMLPKRLPVLPRKQFS